MIASIVSPNSIGSTPKT
uniref:Uncharacterized protein n=1 Tax=Anopheles dirus TaxID=7168 RepID=A0A182NX52_9DIPT